MPRLPVLPILLLTLSAAATAQPVRSIHGFFDINFEVLEDPGADSRFRMGGYDTFITGALDDRMTYLSEVTFEHEGADGWELALERLWVRYEVSRPLSLSAGKFHTAVGQWNRRYHHGSLLFDSIDKPATRGLFPIHTTGVLIEGREISEARISYALMLGNGTGSTPKTDNDDGKSLNLHVQAQPIDGFDIGLSVYREATSAGAGRGEIPMQAGAAAEDITLLMLAPSLVVQTGDAMLEAEFVLAASDAEDSGSDATARAFYVLGAWMIDEWTPFQSST